MRHITTKNWNNQQPHYAIIIGKMIDTTPKYVTKDGLFFVDTVGNETVFIRECPILDSAYCGFKKALPHGK